MGHTVYAMRWIIYYKIHRLRTLVKALREPEKSVAEGLIMHLYQNISAVTCANPMPAEIEGNMIFTILLQEKIQNKKTVYSEIDDLTLLLFSIIVMFKVGKLDINNIIHDGKLSQKSLGYAFEKSVERDVEGGINRLLPERQ